MRRVGILNFGRIYIKQYNLYYIYIIIYIRINKALLSVSTSFNRRFNGFNSRLAISYRHYLELSAQLQT